MFRATISKNGEVTNQAYFSSEELATQWVSAESASFPIGFTSEITDVSVEIAMANEIKRLEEIGERIQIVCQRCYKIVVGFNVDRRLTQPQIIEMKSTFNDIKIALQDLQPWTAKALIQALSPDGVLVTSEMKSTLLSVLEGF